MPRIIVGVMTPSDALAIMGRAGVSHEDRHSVAERLNIRTDIVEMIDLDAHIIHASRLQVVKEMPDPGMVWLQEVQVPW